MSRKSDGAGSGYEATAVASKIKIGRSELDESWSADEESLLRQGVFLESANEVFLLVDLKDSLKLLKVNSDSLSEKYEVGEIDADDFRKIKAGFEVGRYETVIGSIDVNPSHIIGAVHNYFSTFDQVVPDYEVKDVDMSWYEIPLEEILIDLRSRQESAAMAREVPIGNLDTQSVFHGDGVDHVPSYPDTMDVAVDGSMNQEPGRSPADITLGLEPNDRVVPNIDRNGGR